MRSVLRAALLTSLCMPSSLVAQVPAPVAPSVSVPLWQQLNAGMSYTDAAAALRGVSGIKTVTVKMKRGNPAGLSIAYVGSGVAAGPMTATITPTFVADVLDTVTLTTDDCESASRVQNKTVGDVLKDKYGHSSRVTVVNDQGVKTGDQMAYWNDQTHIVVAWREHNDARDALGAVGQSGTGALGKIADSLALTSAKEDLAACPDDRGARVETTITYERQSAFLGEQQAFHDKQAADKEATRKAF